MILSEVKLSVHEETVEKKKTEKKMNKRQNPIHTVKCSFVFHL